MLSIFISYLIFLLLTLFLLYIAGNFFLKFFRIYIKETFTALFTKTVLGSVLFVVASAVFFTKGVTVMLFLLPVLLLFTLKYANTNHDGQTNTSFSNSQIVTIIAGVILIFCWRFGHIYNPDMDMPLLPHWDWVFYANCVDFLISFGKENSSLDYVYGNEMGTSPYHYFHLWFCAGLSRLFNTNTLLTLVLNVYAIGTILTWFGFCALYGFYKPLKTKNIILCFLMVFISGLAFDYYTRVQFMKYIYVFAFNTLSMPKTFPVYIFSIAGMLFFLRKKEFEGVLCLICVFIVSIGTTIGIFPAIITWQGIKWIKHKKYNWKITAILIIFTVGIFSFYRFLTKSTNSHVNTNFTDIVYKLGDPNFFKTVFNIIAGANIQFFLIFVPYFLVFLLVFRTIKLRDAIEHSLFQVFILCYIYSLLGWAFFNYKTTTTQIFYKISSCWFTIFSVWLIFKSYIRLNNTNLKSNLSAIIALFVLNGILCSASLYRIDYPYSKDYLMKIKRIESQLSTRGAFILDSKDYKHEFSYISNLTILGSYLAYSSSRTFPLSISPFSFQVSQDPILAKMQVEALKNTPFWIFVEKQNKNKEFVSLVSSQLKFIDELKINYLICTKNVSLPSMISERVKFEIKDTNTGERFLLLK